MSNRSLLAITAGTAGAIILGYCIYFDQKRRSDPEYRRKVHERRLREYKQQTVGAADYSDDDTDGNDNDDIDTDTDYNDIDNDNDNDNDNVSVSQVLAHQIADTLHDNNDRLVMERFFNNEMQLGEQLISHGNIADGVSHFANAIMMCNQPFPVIQTIQESLPESVFMPLLMKLTELQSNSSSTKDNSTSNPDIA